MDAHVLKDVIKDGPALMRALDEHVQEASDSSLTLQELRLLFILDPQKEIAKSIPFLRREMGIKTAADKLVTSLEDKGYVTRILVTSPKRYYGVILTPHGAQTLEKVMRSVSKELHDQGLANNFSRLRDTLKQVVSHLT